MTQPQRDRLARQQAELLRALLTDGPAPKGFDPGRLEVEAKALRAKRRRVVAMIEPDVCADLADRFVPLFTEYAKAYPRIEGSRARDDARAFVEWLRERGHLPKLSWWQRRRATKNR
ncbi:hypothetical protein KIPE111705_36570 [Kibdelosporangium persicum]|uniref:SCO6045-like C-terminal domain-containing protein n=1 Tax=Kibdelosporangium persicum TaxID=2698649 RepID=A0ABX2FC70_9PSEU|nr:hypothetical protein [Kibdelosporangium persicum]NRN68495.1 hypothetical protein [Kibdelosporangium persicum]